MFAWIAGNDMDLDATGFEQRGLVGERLGASAGKRRERVAQEVAANALWRLGGPQVARRSTVATTRPRSMRLSVSATGRIGIAAPWSAAAAATAATRSDRDERPRGVVDQDDRRSPRPARSNAGGKPAPTNSWRRAPPADHRS